MFLTSDFLKSSFFKAKSVMRKLLEIFSMVTPELQLVSVPSLYIGAVVWLNFKAFYQMNSEHLLHMGMMKTTILTLKKASICSIKTIRIIRRLVLRAFLLMQI